MLCFHQIVLCAVVCCRCFAGRLTHEPLRPVRQCTQQQRQPQALVAANSTSAVLGGPGPPGMSGRAGAESQGWGARPVATAAADEPREGAYKQQQPLLAGALAAVTDLAMCSDAPAADAAFAVACRAFAGILEGSAASDSAAVVSLKQDLQSLYMAVSAGEAALPTVLQQLMGQLRKLTTDSSVAAMLAANSRNSDQQPAAVPLKSPRAAIAQLLSVR